MHPYLKKYRLLSWQLLLIAFVLGTFQQPLLELTHWGAHFLSGGHHFHTLDQHTHQHSHKDLTFISSLLRDTSPDSTPLASDKTTDKQTQIYDFTSFSQIFINKGCLTDFAYILHRFSKLHLKVPSPPPEVLLA